MTNPDARILIARVPPVNPHPYDVVLDWLRRHHPQLGRFFDLCGLAFTIPEDSNYKVHTAWLQDPVDRLNPPAYAAELDLVRQCRERGIKVINPIDKHNNLSKIEADKRLAAAGIRTPKITKVETVEHLKDHLCSVAPPVVLRENRYHQGEFYLIENMEQAKAAPLELYDEPVLSEFLSVRSDDGLYRKFRCVVVGDQVISHHLQISDGWITHGKKRISNLQTREDELTYLNAPDPHEDVMCRACKALDLEYLAVDYGIAPDGEVVVWEANQYPHLHFSTKNLMYRNFAMDRTIAAIVLQYLQEAEIDPPKKLVQQASYD